MQRLVLRSGAVPIERGTCRKMGAEIRGAEGVMLEGGEAFAGVG